MWKQRSSFGQVHFSSFHFEILPFTNAISMVTSYCIKITNYGEEMEANKKQQHYSGIDPFRNEFSSFEVLPGTSLASI